MTVSVQQAQSDLPSLINQLAQGREVVITRGGQPVAKLVGQGPRPSLPRQPGWAKDIITHISEDFDAPLADFKEYMV
jgi:antitoxin (DNA-binding transcriptional repressor) of toxin-antitoxin stability system